MKKLIDKLFIEIPPEQYGSYFLREQINNLYR